MPLPTIPAWIPPRDTGQPSAEALNNLGTLPKANFAAANAIIPITYGRDRLYGQIFVAHVDETLGNLYVAASFCEGEIGGFEQIIIDRVDALANKKAYVGLKNRGFESGAGDGWTTTTISTVEARTGTYSNKIASAVGGPNTISELNPAPPEASEILMTGWMMRDPLALPDANATIGMRWYTAGGAPVGSRDTGTPQGDDTNLAALGTVGWQELRTVVTVPATATQWAYDFGESAGTTGFWYCDDAATFLLDEDSNPTIPEVVAYVGTATQLPDSMLIDVLTGYNDSILNTAYMVLRSPVGGSSGFPRIEAIIQGLKVFDPRSYNAIYDDNADPQFANADETDVTLAQWFNVLDETNTIGTDGWTSETSDPSPASSTYAEMIDNNDDSQGLVSKIIPCDITKDYTITVYAKQPSGDRRNYLGFNFFDAAGLIINNSSSPVSDATGWGSVGTYHYHDILNAAFPATWTKYQFDFGPSAGADATIPTGAVTMGIISLLVRTGPVGTNTTVRLSDYRVFEGLKETEQDPADSSTWGYTQNPTICFRDMITRHTSWNVLDQGIGDLANCNDELIGGIPRREIGLTFPKPQSVPSWVKGFRTYMGGFIGWEDGSLRVVPNRPDVEAPGAAVFDASAGTWIDMGDQPELDVGTGDFTLEAVFKAPTSAATNKTIACKKLNEGALGAGYVLYMNTVGKIVGRVDDGTNQVTITSTASFDDSVFHHAALVIDQTGNTIDLIIDDLVAATQASISAVTLTLNNAQPFRIGGLGNNFALFDGTIDEVRLWNDVRTPTELSDNRGREIPDPTADASLVGYWRLNDLTGSATVVDSSANSNIGTLAGATVLAFGDAQIIPEGVAVHFTVDDIVKDSLNLKRRSLRQVPNSVAIDYEDSSGSRWFTARVQSDSPRVTNGDEQRRLSRVSLPGIHNASQASREAVERLNWYLTDLEGSVTLFDPAWELQHGSIIAITHPIGLDAKLFRVRGITSNSGRYVVDFTEYDPAIYSDEVVADPTIPDTNLGDPLNPPTVANLVIAEELFNYKTGTTGSRVRITFDATGYPFLSQYLIEGYVDDVKVWQTTTQANNVVTPGVEEIVDTLGTPTDYEVRVYIQSPFAQGQPAIDNVQIDGKFAIPGDVPGITAIQTGAGQVSVAWESAVDIDIWRYELKLGTTSDTWATATTTDLMDDRDRVFLNLALGTHRFFVKAIDSVKQESAIAAFTDVTLVAPSAVSTVGGFEVASEVRLNWVAAGGFVERYRVAYSDIPETFETTLDIVDTLRFQTKDVPEGTFTFKIYSQDALGNESLTPATIDIEVTSDADAFLADTYNFVQATTAIPTIVTNGTLTNMVEYVLRVGTRQFWVTNMADVFISIAPSDFTNHTSDALANYHSAGASLWLSETKDFGLPLTGSWNLTHDVLALNGIVEIELELSTDNITFVSFGTSGKGEYRYARVRITTAASPGTATGFVKSPIMSLKINVVPLEESGEGVSSATAGAGATINLSREYTALKEIVAQPKNTIASGSAVTAIVDNIIVGANTGIECDGTNYLAGGDWATLDFGTGDFSIEYWTKHTGSATADEYLLAKRNAALDGYQIRHQYGTNEIDFTIDDGTNQVIALTTGDALPNDGDKHHIGITINRTSDEVNIYIDSVLAGGSPHSIASVTGNIDNASNFTVFANSAGGLIHEAGGLIDELRVWSDVRTPTEITDNYQTELDMTITHTGLVGYWRMNGVTSTVMGGTTTDDAVPASTNDLTDTGAGDLTFIDMGTSSPVQKINSFDVFIFDIFGQQLAEQFQWKWKAV